MKYKILVLGKIHQSGLDLFKNYKQFELVTADDKPKNILDITKDVHGIIVRMTPINEELIKNSNNLKIVSRHGVGFNTVNVDELSLRNIPLSITEDVNSTAVSEHAFAMMIGFSKFLIGHDNGVRKENFKIRDLYNSFELKDKKILIIGYGRIGRKFANLCNSFGMEVLIADKFLKKSLINEKYVFSNNFEDLINDVDFISLHSPHEPNAPPMFSKKQFKNEK